MGAPAGSHLLGRHGELSAQAGTGPGAAWRLIRSRQFGPYFVGNAASASGTWFQNLAASILVFQLTHSAFMLGVLNFCQFAPVLLLAPWAGGIADRFDRRRLLIVTQSGSAAVFGSPRDPHVVGIVGSVDADRRLGGSWRSERLLQPGSDSDGGVAGRA